MDTKVQGYQGMHEAVLEKTLLRKAMSQGCALIVFFPQDVSSMHEKECKLLERSQAQYLKLGDSWIRSR